MRKPIEIDWTGIDPLVRQIYADRGYRQLAALARKTGIDSRRLGERAMMLGLNQRLFPVPIRYSDSETQMIIDSYPMSMIKLQRRLVACGYPRRTEGQLSGYLYKLRKQGRLPDKDDALEDRDHYSINQLSDLLGVPHRTVAGWVRQGLLPSVEDRPEGEGDRRVFMHQIRRRDLQAFLRDYSGHWDCHKCDHFWVVDLLTAAASTAPMRGHRQNSCGSGSAALPHEVLA